MAVEKQIEVMDEEEMKNAYKTLNSWKWPETFGEKPEGWDELPNYRKPYMDACKTKEDIIRPYMKAIRRKIRHEEIYPSSDIQEMCKQSIILQEDLAETLRDLLNRIEG